MKSPFFTFLFGLISLSTFSQNDGDRILGRWLNEQKNAEIEIYKQDGKYYGKVLKITELEKMEMERLEDAEKEEKIKRIQGKIILKNLVYKKNKWVNGTIIAPKKNQEADCVMSISSDYNTLNINITKGWFSKTINWIRVSK